MVEIVVMKTCTLLDSLSYVIVRPAIIYGTADKLGISKETLSNNLTVISFHLI